MTSSGHGLSLRHRQVLKGVVEGKTNKEIAKDLHIAERTVKYYVTELMNAFGCRNRTELALTALRLRWVEVEPHSY